MGNCITRMCPWEGWEKATQEMWQGESVLRQFQRRSNRRGEQLVPGAYHAPLRSLHFPVVVFCFFFFSFLGTCRREHY